MIRGENLKREDLNIITNIKIIEEIKANIICVVGELFHLLTKGSNVARDSILNSISKGIMLLYILGQRLGYSFEDIDKSIGTKLEKDLSSNHEYEKDGESLSKLESYLKKNR